MRYIILFSISLFPILTHAQQGCSDKIQLASASTWDNIRNSKDSLKFKTSQIIEQATKNKSNSSFIITSTPNKYLKDYKDRDYCEKKLQQTSGANRLSYESPLLKSADLVNDWISGLSQGKSVEGEKLYKECDKSCSPAYEYQVNFTDNNYKIKALVTCSHARDKNDNQYKIKATCS